MLYYEFESDSLMLVVRVRRLPVFTIYFQKKRYQMLFLIMINTMIRMIKTITMISMILIVIRRINSYLITLEAYWINTFRLIDVVQKMDAQFIFNIVIIKTFHDLIYIIKPKISQLPTFPIIMIITHALERTNIYFIIIINFLQSKLIKKSGRD